jgi:hypothetical protein
LEVPASVQCTCWRPPSGSRTLCSSLYKFRKCFLGDLGGGNADHVPQSSVHLTLSTSERSESLWQRCACSFRWDRSCRQNVGCAAAPFTRRKQVRLPSPIDCDDGIVQHHGIGWGVGVNWATMLSPSGQWRWCCFCKLSK